MRPTGERGEDRATRTGLFGGVFDPVHLAHLSLARHALEEARLDRVFFIPTGTPPHKTGAFASAAHRRAMTLLALAGERRFRLCDLELSASGPAYTFETVERFARAHPDDELFYLCGFDSLLQLPTWRAHESILARATLLVAPRPGYSARGAEVAPHLLARTRLLERMAPDDLSSTALRRLLAAGDPAAAALLPPDVADYIARHGLYR